MDSTVAVELDPAAVSPPVLGAEQHDQKMKQEGEIEVMAREFERLVEKAGLEMDPSLTGYSEVVQRIEAKVREDIAKWLTDHWLAAYPEDIFPARDDWPIDNETKSNWTGWVMRQQLTTIIADIFAQRGPEETT